MDEMDFSSYGCRCRKVTKLFQNQIRVRNLFCHRLYLDSFETFESSLFKAPEIAGRAFHKKFRHCSSLFQVDLIIRPYRIFKRDILY